MVVSEIVPRTNEELAPRPRQDWEGEDCCRHSDHLMPGHQCVSKRRHDVDEHGEKHGNADDGGKPEFDHHGAVSTRLRRLARCGVRRLPHARMRVGDVLCHLRVRRGRSSVKLRLTPLRAKVIRLSVPHALTGRRRWVNRHAAHGVDHLYLR